jgi:hypothetical protein
MTKHRKSRKRSQRGGSWYNPVSWFGSSDPNAPKKSVWESISGTTSNAIQGASGVLSTTGRGISNSASDFGTSVNNVLNTNIGATPAVVPQPMPAPQPVPIQGGRRKKRCKTMKGGKGGSEFAFYASPVSGLKVVEPTYLIGAPKGGSKKRKHSVRKISRKRRH